MMDDKRFEPAEDEPITKDMRKTGDPTTSGGVPTDAFPPFDDPAFSAEPADLPPTDPTQRRHPPRDTEYAGHPEFSQDAAKNKLPANGIGNSQAVNDANEKTRHSDGQRFDPPAGVAMRDPDEPFNKKTGLVRGGLRSQSLQLAKSLP